MKMTLGNTIPTGHRTTLVWTSTIYPIMGLTRKLDNHCRTRHLHSKESPCDPKWWGIGIRIEDDILITQNGPVNLSVGAHMGGH